MMNTNSTKRFLCRAIFLALGLLPLVGTFSWAAYRGLNQTNTSYAQWIGEQFGLECSIQKVIHARPGTLRLEGLSFQDAESLRRLGHCNEAIIQFDSIKRVIHIPSLLVVDSEFRRLLELLDERVLQNPRILELPTAVQIEELTIQSNDSPAVTLRDIRLDTSLTDVGPQANAKFTLIPESGSSGVAHEPIRMDVIRETAMTRAGSRGASSPPIPPVTKLNLLTGNARLPGRLLAGFFGSNHLGPTTTFQGNIHLDSNDRGSGAWTGDVSGHLDNLQLEDICSMATGEAKLTFRKATFDKGVATLLDGTLAVGSGKLRSEFVESAIQNLGVTIAEGYRDQLTSGFLPFDALNVDFVIENGQSSLRGTVPQGSPGDIAIVHGESLLSQPPSSVTNVDLLRTLLGLTQEQIPVANDSALLRAIPQ